MSEVLVCNACGFSVPAPLDPIGAAIMQQHLRGCGTTHSPSNDPVPSGDAK